MKEVIRWSESLEADVQIQSDGKTCWVNGPSGDCIGRWSPSGVDVHRSAEEQLEGRGQCLDCVPHGSWPYFVTSMLKHYGVEVPSDMINQEYR